MRRRVPMLTPKLSRRQVDALLARQDHYLFHCVALAERYLPTTFAADLVLRLLASLNHAMFFEHFGGDHAALRRLSLAMRDQTRSGTRSDGDPIADANAQADALGDPRD